MLREHSLEDSMARLTLKLTTLPSVLGIYGAQKDMLPMRMARLHPDAAAAFHAAETALGQRIRVSDMFRTAEQSLQAMQEKSGVQPPGFSLHNYGIAIDVAVDAMLPAFRGDKITLDAFMRGFGWYCHRKDNKRGSEDWHYNYLGSEGPALIAQYSPKSSNTSAAADARIQALYGPELKLDEKEVQECLAFLKLYSGEIDGKIGPRSQQSIMAFQRAWKLPATGEVDPKTERTLAYVASSIAPEMGA
jgi:hypothetical protein